MRIVKTVAGKQRGPVTSIATRQKLIHLQSDGPRTFCGRPVSAVRVAKDSGREVTCQRCLKAYLKAAEEDSRYRGHERNRIEDRAKACFEIWDRATGAGLVWERVTETQREAFRQILDYAEGLFRDDEAERREDLNTQRWGGK
jgi:hypothetical protein